MSPYGIYIARRAFRAWSLFFARRPASLGVVARSVYYFVLSIAAQTAQSPNNAPNMRTKTPAISIPLLRKDKPIMPQGKEKIRKNKKSPMIILENVSITKKD